MAKKEQKIDYSCPNPTTEKFELTFDGLAANRDYLIQQHDSGNPNYRYVGNCTKKFADDVVDRFFVKTWKWVKSVDFPDGNEFPVDFKKLENEIVNLIRKDNSWKTRSRLIRHFHKGTFLNSNRDGHMTPIQFWKSIQADEQAFRDFYHNRLRCSDWFKEKDKTGKYPDNRPYLVEGAVPPFIWSIGVDTSRKAPLVSFFKPSLAKYLVKKYLDEFNEVGDVFSGMSGRLLGVLAAGKKYSGSDLNKNVLKESRELMEFAEPVFRKCGLDPKWSLKYEDAIVTKHEFESMLVCSPYGASEQWNGISSNISCDKWIDIVLTNNKARRYVFVTDDDIVKYRPYIKEQLENTSHFGSNFEDVVVIDRADLVDIKLDISTNVLSCQ